MASSDVSNTRLYLGNLPRNATKVDIENHFAAHGTGEILEVKLMNGFGFIEYKDPMDARDVVPAFHGSIFMGERLTVQFARGSKHPGPGPSGHDRAPPRPRRTAHRMQITGLPPDTSWQDLKDFARQSGSDVVYSEAGRDSGRGSFVEFESASDLKTAVEKLDGREFKGGRVQCVADTQPEYRGRSRSPNGRRPYPPSSESYDRRGPPRSGGFSPRHEGSYGGGYRDRSPRRDYYGERGPRASYRSPPRHPMDEYPPPPRGRYEDPYRRDYPPPQDPYAEGRPPYDRPPRDFPAREGAYPPRNGGYSREYDRGGRY